MFQKEKQPNNEQQEYSMDKFKDERKKSHVSPKEASMAATSAFWAQLLGRSDKPMA
jgi:hypothetical protein